MTQELVGVRYVEAGPIHYCSPGSLLLGQGDYAIVRTDRGERLGWIVLTPDQTEHVNVEGPVRVVDRLASLEEVERHREQKLRAEDDVRRAQAAATRVDGRVRVASLTYALGGDFAEVTYTAREGAALDDRLEREIGKELDVPHLQVEQVGDRDRAKSLGGLGQCGRGLCCSTWMTEFPAISIKMAKDQGLAPNPSKISGVCGRLLCCLSFEVEDYRQIVGSLPTVGKKLTTPAGKAKVLSINALTEMVRLRFDESGQIIEISTEAVKRQMGTTLRPEELDAEIEEALRAKDRRRTENLVAVLAPIDRPLRDTSDADAPQVDEDERARRRRDRGTRSGDARRSSSPTGDAPTRRRGNRPAGGRPAGGPDASAPAAGESRSGIRITRRRAGTAAPGTDGSAPTEGGNRTRRRRRGAGGGGNAAGPDAGSQRPTSRPQGAGDAGSGNASSEGDAAGRRRRRGRRGGRRRSGSEGGGGEGGNGGGTPSGGTE